MDEAAVLSKSAYDYFREGPGVAQKELSEYGLEGYQIDTSLSDDYSVVIERPDGSAVISYRGTDALEDVMPDIQILLGRHSPFLDRFAVHRQLITDRFERASEKFEATVSKHTEVAYLTGHSLGGSQAISVARKHGAIRSLSLLSQRLRLCMRGATEQSSLLGWREGTSLTEWAMAAVTASELGSHPAEEPKRGFPYRVLLIASISSLNNVAFGYDVGVVSGSLTDMACSLRLSTFEQEVATSGLNFVSGLGALLVCVRLEIRVLTLSQQ